MTGSQQAGLVGERSIAEVLAQGNHGEQADDSDHNHGCLEYSRGHETERQGLVMTPDDRVHGDGGAHASHGIDDVEQAADDHSGVRTRADDVARVLQHRSEEVVGGRYGGSECKCQVEHTRTWAFLIVRSRPTWCVMTEVLVM